MISQSTKYELLEEQPNSRQKHIYLQVCLLFALCAMSSIAVFSTWTVIYRKHINIPPKLNDIPDWLPKYSLNKLIKSNESKSNPTNESLSMQFDDERIIPSKYGNYLLEQKLSEDNRLKLVCYYAIPNEKDREAYVSPLQPQNIDANLCTHIHIGIVPIVDNQISIDDKLDELFRRMVKLKQQNSAIKLLLWVGGPNRSPLNELVRTHANRKLFIKSLKATLETYRFDGVDLDWEFPTAYNRERQHFSQLLHEIRREYERERRTYLLSIAVTGIEGIAFYAYDISMIKENVDYVSIMTYDYHFYSAGTPFTGLNAPLYKRYTERSVLSTLNINSSVYYWYNQGLDKERIVIGLPTYGHSFTLVNPLNVKIGSPAMDNGRVGQDGFVTYSDICWFKRNNIFVGDVYDTDTCSPYLYAGTEWISYDNEKSLKCKTDFIKSNGFGGAMLFSLNTDDYSAYCDIDTPHKRGNQLRNFPLARTIYSTLFDMDNN